MVAIINPYTGQLDEVGDQGQAVLAPHYYENCKYLVTNSVTSLGSVMLDGSPTPAEGYRALAPVPGTFCTILVYVNGAWIVDPNFVTRKGAKVTVTETSAGIVEYVQTAATGSATAVFARSSVTPTQVTAASLDEIMRIEFASPGAKSSLVGTRNETVTFARSGSANFLLDGAEVTATANQARVGRNGLLVEPACANVAPTPTNLLSASWTIGDASSYLTRTAVADPLGGTTACKLLEDSTTHQRYIYAIPSVTTNTRVAISIAFKALGTGTKRYLAVQLNNNSTHYCIFDPVTGMMTATEGGAVSELTVCKSLGNGWFLGTFLITTGTGIYQNFLIGLTDTATDWRSYAANGTGGVYIWRPQIEYNNMPTSFCDVGANRSVESAYAIAPAFADPFSVEVLCTPSANQSWIRAATDPILCFGTNAALNSLALRCASNLAKFSVFDAATAEKYVTEDMRSSAAVANGFRRLLCASGGISRPAIYQDGTQSATAPAGAGAAIATCTIGSARKMYIGCDSAGAAGGVAIKEVVLRNSTKLPAVEASYNVQAWPLGGELTAWANIVAFVGHSWVAGVGSAAITEPYIRVATRLLGAQYAEHGYGIGSNTVSQTLDRCRKYVWGRGYQRLVIDTIVNDVNALRPAADIIADLDALIREAIADGIPKIVVVNCASGSDVNAVAVAVNAWLATRAGITVYGLYAAFDDPGNAGHMLATLGDGLHPTQLGHTTVGTALAALLA